MVKALLGLALLLSPVAMTPASVEAWQLARSETLTIAASDGHAYQVMVAWPDSPPPPQGWPVLWVLDGADNFAVAAVTARRLARAGARSGIEPGVVVAIESGTLPRRVLDYTPEVRGYAIPAGAPAHGLAIGGADDFLSFLKNQVRPMITRRWRVDPARHTLLGHSFGGMLTLHALFRGEAFSRFVAVSPSLWFGDDLIAQGERRYADPAMRPTVLVATGEIERGPDGQSASAAEALTARLIGKGVDARFRTFSNQTHGTTMLAAMGDAITVAFGREGTQ